MTAASPPPKKPLPGTIAIIGGGLGGVALAIGLARQGVPFHIYEAAPSFGEIGAGVTFGPNVIRAMHGISPALLRAYARHVTANEPPDTAGAFLTCRKGHAPAAGGGGDRDGLERVFDIAGAVQEVGGVAFPARCSVHRARLLDEIVGLLPGGSASFGKPLVGVRETGVGGGNVLLEFADGTSALASAVVGCDGIRSVTRRHLHGPDAEAVFSGFHGYRAMVKRADYEAVLGKELAATGNLFLCSDGYTIAYPVDHGAALNMFATCVKPGYQWVDDAWQIPSTTEELLGDTKGWHPGVVDLLVKHGTIVKWAMFHSPHDKLYFRDRICIMGDAAHATTPHMGAGAGMAIEDAFILSQLLGKAHGLEDVSRAFEAYDAVRRPRTQRVITDSKDNVARYLVTADAEGEELQRALDGYQVKFGWLWKIDLDDHLQEAVSIFEKLKLDA